MWREITFALAEYAPILLVADLREKAVERRAAIAAHKQQVQLVLLSFVYDSQDKQCIMHADFARS